MPCRTSPQSRPAGSSPCNRERSSGYPPRAPERAASRNTTGASEALDRVETPAARSHRDSFACAPRRPSRRSRASATHVRPQSSRRVIRCAGLRPDAVATSRRSSPSKTPTMPPLPRSRAGHASRHPRIAGRDDSPDSRGRSAAGRDPAHSDTAT